MYNGGLKFWQAQAMLAAIDQVKADMEKVRVPLLVLHGEEDTVNLVRGSQELVRRAGTADKKLIEVICTYCTALH
jgi:alpha-beta hydrolase superfamily lysophospholipase